VIGSMTPREDTDRYITILAVGTRGDVQPYVAPGLGLQEAGHKVRLVAADIFKA
jgi:sterol 3beta-glucosyltransferase